jgi:hypothetical protein
MCRLWGAEALLPINPKDSSKKFGLAPIVAFLRFVSAILALGGLLDLIGFRSDQTLWGIRGPSGMGLVFPVIALAVTAFYGGLLVYLENYRARKLQELRNLGQEKDIAILLEQRLPIKDLLPWSITAILPYILAVLLQLPGQASTRPKGEVSNIVTVDWQQLAERVWRPVDTRVPDCER